MPEPTINKVWFEGVNRSNGVQQFLNQGIHIYNLIHVDSQNALNCIEDILNRTVNWVIGHTKYNPMSSITNNGCIWALWWDLLKHFTRTMCSAKKTLNSQITYVRLSIMKQYLCCALPWLRSFTIPWIKFIIRKPVVPSPVQYSLHLFRVSPLPDIPSRRLMLVSLPYGLADACPYPCLPPQTITRLHFDTTLIKTD